MDQQAEKIGTLRGTITDLVREKASLKEALGDVKVANGSLLADVRQKMADASDQTTENQQLGRRVAELTVTTDAQAHQITKLGEGMAEANRLLLSSRKSATKHKQLGKKYHAQ